MLYGCSGARFSGYHLSASHPSRLSSFRRCPSSSILYSMAFLRKASMYSISNSEQSLWLCPASHSRESVASGYRFMKGKALSIRNSPHSYSPTHISAGMPSMFREPQYGFTCPQHRTSLSGESPCMDMMARALSGFHAAKLYGDEAWALWLMYATGTVRSSSYPDFPASSSMASSKPS